jgi:hypothetical protein
VQGKQIQAIVPAECLGRFADVFVEGGVYIISFFYVRDNISPFMITFNQYKLEFSVATNVIPCQSLTLPHYSLRLFASDRIRNYRNGLNYLIGMWSYLCTISYIFFYDFFLLVYDLFEILYLIF